MFFIKSIEKNLWNLGLGKKFLDLTLKHNSLKKKKVKVDDFDLIKIRNFYSPKDSVKSLEENIHNHIFNKRIVSGIYKQLSKFTNKTPKDPITKWAKYMKRHFTKKLYIWQIST